MPDTPTWTDGPEEPGEPDGAGEPGAVGAPGAPDDRTGAVVLQAVRSAAATIKIEQFRNLLILSA
ncbi:MAG: hypothetical protein OXS28_12060 [Gammaproteobacteria bacterium]|nr:hypothetical protein [Gammaproteobacteria bacterium]MDE0156327.1 hypothetical protein [Gammaproteobacteria bacterium]MDE0285556.1 hypothetical protein [Gammaproteobacteria bacterium]